MTSTDQDRLHAELLLQEKRLTRELSEKLRLLQGLDDD